MKTILLLITKNSEKGLFALHLSEDFLLLFQNA